jgi:hypothetical protein
LIRKARHSFRNTSNGCGLHISTLELFLDEGLVRGDQQIPRSGSPAVDILILTPGEHIRDRIWVYVVFLGKCLFGE